MDKDEDRRRRRVRARGGGEGEGGGEECPDKTEGHVKALCTQRSYRCLRA